MRELSLHNRSRALADMAARPLDVLVIGGGVTGMGAALDAAVRGLRVGLVERDDFACGTSSRSSKMIHGGLRYLAYGDVPLVREALRERRGIQERVPHLVRPLPMLLPIRKARMPLSWLKFNTGLWAYDLLGAWRAGVRHSWLDVAGVVAQAPNVETAGIAGALTYADSQADDVSLVLALTRTAARHGALVVNGAEVTRLNDENGRVTGATISVDDGDGERSSVDVRAAITINATGVWADTVPGIDDAATVKVMPSKGIHLMVKRERAGIESGVSFFTSTGTNVFIEPWSEELAIVGTSDEPYSGDVRDPEATPEEIQTLLTGIAPMLRHPLTVDDVIATWAGLRPLVLPSSGDAKDSQDISRRHCTIVTAGLITVVGGKLTTYRQMAQDAVDAAVRQLARDLPECTTRALPLEGAGLVATGPTVAELSERFQVSRRLARHAIGRYGTGAETLLSLVQVYPALAEPIHAERPDIAAEVVFAARYQMARKAEDVIRRRTRLSIETSDAGASATGRVQHLINAVQAGDYAPRRDALV